MPGSTYERDGFAFPIRVLTEQQSDVHRRALETLEAEYAHDDDAIRLLRGAPTIVAPFAAEIMRLKSVLDPVSAILGDNLLVMGANLFIKEPGTPDFISWHQDLTYWGYDQADEVTAWVALSSATPESGCMRFVAGSHRSIVEHRDTFEETNMLSRGQEVTVEVDEADAVDVVLQPGEMSLHHGHMVHASSANASSDRRIGLAIRYVTPTMQQRSGVKPFAQLVSGVDTEHNFRHVPPPASALSPEAVDWAHRALAVQSAIGFDGVSNEHAPPRRLSL